MSLIGLIAILFVHGQATVQSDANQVSISVHAVRLLNTGGGGKHFDEGLEEVRGSLVGLDYPVRTRDKPVGDERQRPVFDVRRHLRQRTRGASCSLSDVLKHYGFCLDQRLPPGYNDTMLLRWTTSSPYAWPRTSWIRLEWEPLIISSSVES